MEPLFTNPFDQFGINWSVIWSDSSIFVCLWLVSVMLLVCWGATNYRNSVREEYLVKTTSARIKWEQEKEKLESENRFLTEAFYEYRSKTISDITEHQDRINQLSAENNDFKAKIKLLSRARNEKGQFIVTSGKGHGKRK